MRPQCGLCMSWGYTSKVSERWEISVPSGASKLYTVRPNLVTKHIKLDLAKHFRVPLCNSYEPETSIFLVAIDGFILLTEGPGT